MQNKNSEVLRSGSPSLISADASAQSICDNERPKRINLKHPNSGINRKNDGEDDGDDVTRNKW